MATVSANYIRLCPTCGDANQPAALRCACGARLAGIDLTLPASPATPAAAAAPPRAPADEAPQHQCPHSDCGQPNPPGSLRCLYCDRPLAGETPVGANDNPPSLLRLPPALATRYRIERALPTAGAEADLLVVTPLAGGPAAVAKLYRHGIRPDPAVMACLARINPAHRVELIETGLADSFAWELMEYCPHGSLRGWLDAGTPDDAGFIRLVEELSTALTAIHNAGLLHRDLKPENILVRHREPLDLVITDFGSASVPQASVHFTGLARTLAYGAPEALSGVIDAKADWWSLGMILLEASTGKHPFAGLSEAVILHHLATRPVAPPPAPASAVNGKNRQKLLRGLLQRDPRQRWGSDEVMRWLAGDPALPDPAPDPAARASDPYRLGDDLCHDAPQLAVALARHWQTATADLDNGLLLTWLRTGLKDSRRVRLLIDLNQEQRLHVDVKLLRLLIDLAPGLPPVWRGAPLTPGSVLRAADQALHGDEASTAWLDALWEFAVPDAWGAAGNATLADLANRWRAAHNDFVSAWQDLAAGIATADKPQPGEPVNFDEALYGRGSPTRPSPRQLHARLLAIAFDPGWVARWQARVRHSAATLALDCPWLHDQGDLAGWPPSRLLALDTLLPALQRTAERSRARAAAAASAQREAADRLFVELQAAIADARKLGESGWLDDDRLAGLQAAIARFSTLWARYRALPPSSDTPRTRHQALARKEPTLLRLDRLAQAARERLIANRGWFSQQTLVACGLALLLIPAFFTERLLGPLVLAGAGLAFWRWWPLRNLRQQIATLARRLDSL